MKKKKIFLKLIKFLFLIILIVLGFFLGNFVYNKYEENKFKKILTENDATNYEVIERVGNEETTVKVRDRVLISENTETKTWVDGINKKRIVMDLTYKTALITENDEKLKVNSLNNTYIENYFDNPKMKFKYLGSTDRYSILKFIHKKTKDSTLLYINRETNIIEKMEQYTDDVVYTANFDVKMNSVSKEEVEEPDLDKYRIYDSVSSNVNKK